MLRQLFLTTILFSTVVATNNVVTKTITVDAGGSFVHYIPPEGGSKLIKCVVQISKDEISLYPDKLKESTSEYKDKITILNNKGCAYKFDNIESREFEFTPTLSATLTKNNYTRTKMQRLQIKINRERNYRDSLVLTSYSKQQQAVECKPYAGNDKYFCALYTPSGKKVEEGSFCTYKIQYVTKEHIGDWKCILSLPTAVAPVQTIIRVVLESTPILISAYKEDNGYGIIECKVVNATEDIKTCSMITPNITVLNIRENSATKRYDSFGTNFTQKTCRIEFALPVKAEEKGTWKCILDKHHGFINVKQVSKYERHTIAMAKLNDTFEINCEVPYAALNCLVKSPTHEIVSRGSYLNSLNGMCNYKIKTVQEKDFGKWTCHFSRPGAVEDDIITVEVQKYAMLIPTVQHITVDEKDEIEILFRANGPISYCILVDPRGTTYNLWPTTKTAGIEYFGRGFEFGDCGMKMKNITKAFEGSWKCWASTSSIAYMDEKGVQMIAQTTIDVFTRLSIATASSTILICIIGVIALIVVLVILGKFIKEKKAKISPANSVGDANSENSFAMPTRSYM